MGFTAGDQIFRLVDAENTVKRLYAARTKEKLTVASAGEMVGLKQSQLSRIESGVQEFYTGPVREKIEKLASALGVKVKFVDGDWRQMRRGPKSKDSGVAEINDVIASTVPAQPAQPIVPATAQIAAVLHVYKLGALDAEKTLDTIGSILQRG